VIAKRQSAVRPRIDASAFVAVLLALLWALIAEYRWHPHQYQNRIFVQSALVRHSVPIPHASDSDAIRITVTRDGKFFFRSDLAPPENPPILIQRSVAAGSEKRIYLNVDIRAKYKDVATVLDEARSARIENVTIVTAWKRL
jgi:biopolymer transport protein ExbD